MEKRVREKQQILEFIRKTQKAKGLTDADIARKCHIGEGTISRWYATEKDQMRSPNLENLLKVLNFLDVEITFRTEELEDNSSEGNVNSEEDRELNAQIITAIFRILGDAKNSKRDKERLYKILKAFL